MPEERAYWLAWSRIPGAGPILIQRLQEYFGNLTEAWQAQGDELIQIEGVGKKLLAVIEEQRSRLNPEVLLEELQEKQFNFWTPVDKDYPRLLQEIPSLPPVLYYQGEVNLRENQALDPSVAIVGTRHPTEYGLRWTRKISIALAQHGFTIVSGLAAGIDAEAHRACLQGSGRTIAVLGTGIDVVYPRSNLKLYEQIKERGLLLSEYPPGTKPDKRNFPPRNRIIAGLSRASLVMEASQKSGALITARYANEFGRDIYALPGSLDNLQARGCLRLFNEGAQPILGEAELLESLGTIPNLETVELSPTPPPPNLEPHLAQVLETLTTESLPFDFLVETTQLSSGQVSSALLQLELLGLVAQLPGMRYRRS